MSLHKKPSGIDMPAKYKYKYKYNININSNVGYSINTVYEKERIEISKTFNASF